MTNAFDSLQGPEVSGDYFPLSGSSTYARKPMGMTPEEFEKLDRHHFVFREPSSSSALSTGRGRNWPEARGVFAAVSHRLIAWCNDEDHLCLSSLQPGGDLAEAFTRFATSMRFLEESLRRQGHSFARSTNLGYLTSSPGLLGTGLKVTVSLKIPRTVARPGFRDMCTSFGLRPSFTGGLCDIMNLKTFGRSEVDLVNNIMIGCQQLVNMELTLEQSLAAPQTSLRLRPASLDSGAPTGGLQEQIRAAFAKGAAGRPLDSIMVPPKKLEGLMRSISAGLSTKELELVLQSLPKSDDGLISLDAFLSWLCGAK